VADFAKLFRVGEKQYLAFIEPDDEDETLILHQMTDAKDLVIDLKLRGSEQTIQAVFDQLDQQAAENFFSIDIIKTALAA
jgi:hypothetical protein